MSLQVQRVSAIRLGGAGAITLFMVFAICWVAQFLFFPGATHAYLGLFTAADPMSGAALLQGLLWSAVFGFLGGLIGAVSFNLLGRTTNE